jgi:hypothetical protein
MASHERTLASGRQTAAPALSLAELEEAAIKSPESVLQNPMLPLLARDEPSTWRRIVGIARESMFRRTLHDLVHQAPEQVLRDFALDCAERALPLVEALNPQASPFRATVELGRRFVAGQADPSKIAAIRRANPEHYSALNEFEALFDEKAANAARLMASVLVEVIAKTAAPDYIDEDVRVPFHLPMYGEAWAVERTRQLLFLQTLMSP